MNRGLFLDRDGTIIEDHGYMRDPALVHPLPGAVEVLAALAAQGWKLILISNQSGVGRGIISPEEANEVQLRFQNLTRLPFTGVYICSHTPAEHCTCRKPSPYFLELAAREHNLDLPNSWMIGDRESDVLAGINAECSTIWLSNPVHSLHVKPTFIAGDWSQIHRRLSCES